MHADPAALSPPPSAEGFSQDDKKLFDLRASAEHRTTLLQGPVESHGTVPHVSVIKSNTFF